MNTTACFVVAFSIRSFCVIILKLLCSVAPVIGRFPITSHPYFFLGCVRMLTEPFLCLFTYISHRYIRFGYAPYLSNKKRSVQNTVLQHILRTHLLRRKDEADVYIFFSSIHCISQESPSLLRFDSFSSFLFSFSRGDFSISTPFKRQCSSYDIAFFFDSSYSFFCFSANF